MKEAKTWTKKVIKTDLIKIALANLLSQGFLFILTGTFWDDWIYYSHDRVGLWKQFMEAGRPSSAYWIEMVWNLPGNGFRWLVFLMYLLTSIIFYLILKNSGLLNREEALYISILYTVFPINDCRVILCDVVYTVGLTSFFVGCYMFFWWLKNGEKEKKILFRVAILTFFGYSFIINSLLVFYGIVLLCIFFKEYFSGKKVIIACSHMLRYIDFILLPIVFFIGKNLLFPVYGRYENYNIVKANAVLVAACRLPLAVFRQLKLTWFSIFGFLVPHKIIIIFSYFIIALISVRLTVFLWQNRSLKRFFKYLKQNHEIRGILLGVIIFAIGLYPYILVRDTYTVDLIGVPSRDSMLLGPGLALIMFYFFKILLKKKVILKTFLIFICFICTVTCNIHYINYQRDAYWQDSLIEQLRLNDQIREAENILFLSDDSSGIYGTRFYSLNGNAYVAYGDQSRLFLNGYLDLPLLKSDKSVLVDSRGYVMNDYNALNDKLDGVILFNCDINYLDCIRLKILEITDYPAYQGVISQIGELSYYPVQSQKARELLEGYEY